MTPVSKPYLPDRAKLDAYIDGIYQRQWLTNNGELVQELTRRLETYLGVENLLLVANGTLALQVAYRALGLTKPIDGEPAEAISSPFSFVATASTIKWEGMKPVFADIDPQTWCLDPENVEALISSRTRALVPVHVFGNVCDVERLDNIASDHGLKVIYDAAHAFGVVHQGKTVLRWGDASTLSFHATKVFHTIEGGAVIFRDREILRRAQRIINFGFAGGNRITELGLNAKMSEFQAAMGLCVLDEMEQNLAGRESVWHVYAEELGKTHGAQRRQIDCSNNYGYYPIVLNNESQLLELVSALERIQVMPRRYFYPSLDTVESLEPKEYCPISRELARRILCLPIYAGLDLNQVKRICDIVKACLD
ncbi:DegT/DnrJ/EryC1/StrS family aminotransferase [Acidihalobacter prosperus]